MICTSVVPCLSSGLAKNNKIMSMFVQLSRLFLPFFKVVDSCRTCSTKSSHTFRSFFVCGKEQESRKKYVITVQKKFTFLRGFDRKNKVFGISRNLMDRFVFK